MHAPGDRTVSAIVVGYNHAHCLGRCFDSLMGQQGLDGLEVLYIDNASTDSSVATCSSQPQIHVFQNEENVGFARAVNQGLQLARGRYVALVNPDTAIGPWTIARLVDRLRLQPEIGLAAPILLGDDGRPQPSLAHYPTIQGQLLRLLGRRPDGARGWLIGALVVAEAALLRGLRGLDEGYFVYGEDMDLSHRVQRAGRRVHVDPELPVTHTGNPRWTPDRRVRVLGAYMRFLGRHFPRQRLAVGIPITALWLARGLLQGVGLRRASAGLRRIWSRKRDLPPGEW